jgi:hypothetical protein
MGGACRVHGVVKMHTKFWKSLKGRRPKRRWEDFREIGLEGVDWIHWLRIGTGNGLL